MLLGFTDEVFFQIYLLRCKPQHPGKQFKLSTTVLQILRKELVKRSKRLKYLRKVTVCLQKRIVEEYVSSVCAMLSSVKYCLPFTFKSKSYTFRHLRLQLLLLFLNNIVCVKRFSAVLNFHLTSFLLVFAICFPEH